MLSPKKTKYRKHQKGQIKGPKGNDTLLRFGKFGIKCLEQGRIQSRTIEAARRAITRKLKRSGLVWIRIFPDIPVTEKPAEVRMGKGKGAPSYWVCRVQPGQILFEMDGIPESLAKQAATLAIMKLNVKARFIV
jgi:large subunit ribosomal protein L16